MRNFANDEVKTRGMSNVDDDTKVASVSSMDTPVMGKDGEGMSVHDIIGGVFDDEFERNDFMEKLFGTLKRRIPAGRKSTEAQIKSLEKFIGMENGEYTGNSMNAKQAHETGDINATKQSVYGWYGEWADYLEDLKRRRPELFNEEKNRMKKIAGIK
jgi:hypothetical protein